MNHLSEGYTHTRQVSRWCVSSLSILQRLAVVLAVATLSSGSIWAAGISPLGTIVGIFSNPVLQGNILHDPALGQVTFANNAGTDVVGIHNSTDQTLIGNPPEQLNGSSLTWGSFAAQPNIGFSILTFFGGQVPVNFNQQFQVGTFTYLNGTSDLNTLIFGATISFYDNLGNTSTFLASDNIVINTTSNVGPTIQDDADYINICGNNSFICLKSINAIEEFENGVGLTVNLFGSIVGDPVLQLNNVALAPGQNITANGFIGTDLPLGEIPEPGTLFTLPIGLVLCIGFARRRAFAKR
jgi:hypothetical protein